ncbi:hypothetical protein N7493_001640 [Penicillium malachiteum]|uniref:Uncharacterized protein n=1 Tax=Penicillium malachiteum TaxID=1324776 RepID=A0AAD6HVK0_9EURO|nr:hypothetical protein N7493_001640 [Penicillium malachiteum]
MSRNTYNGDNFTKVERYNLTNAAFTCAASSLVMDAKYKSPNPGYAAEDIIILSDALCSLVCALFMELMHHEAGVRTVVVGDRPDSTPMQAPSGTRGAASYNNLNMDFDISNAHAVNTHDTTLAINRTQAFHISQATVNLRDQVRRDHPSNTPLQFRYEPADCRIFFTPSTWYNFSNLWNYAVHATWNNRTLCVAKSTTNLTNHISHPAKSNTADCSLQQKDTCAIELNGNDGSTYEILDNLAPFSVQKLAGCNLKADDCGRNYLCREISVCQKGQVKPVNENRCAPMCFNDKGLVSWCPYGRCVAVNSTHTASSSDVSSRSSPNPGTNVNSQQSSLRRNCQNSYWGYCKPPQRSSCPSALNDNDAPTILPCLENLQDAYVHCFDSQTGYHRCVFYRNSGATSFQKQYRSCSSSTLFQWREKNGSDNKTYDNVGAIGCYGFPEQGPAFIVFHDILSSEIPHYNDLLFHHHSNLGTKVHPRHDWPVNYMLAFPQGDSYNQLAR